MRVTELLPDIERVLRRLLSEQNRDSASATFGCFDRRYWSWKLVDFPEATFQRNVYPLAWWYRRMPKSDPRRKLILEAVRAALLFACRIQHGNGSFDQAFPNEYSFGATAFLVDPLLAAYEVVQDELEELDRAAIEICLRRGADFLCRADESHGHIANHLAGAAWSLIRCADSFVERRYETRARELLDRILGMQSKEGWFLEYEGADPGYQTLCMHYLAQVAKARSIAALDDALDRAVEFLSWCVHPDGSFAGEYGSRRTAVFYPGGIALLAERLEKARSISEFMFAAMHAGNAVGLTDVDMGNLAPLLTSTILLFDARQNMNLSAAPELLPWQKEGACRDFPGAGLFMRCQGRFYSVLGASNGGVLKVFDREAKRLLFDDGGYKGKTRAGIQVTTQVTDLARPCQFRDDCVEFTTPFYVFRQTLPSPVSFLVLRILNLTVMRSIGVGNLVKKILVHVLISGRKALPLHLHRRVEFSTDGVRIRDLIRAMGSPDLVALSCGQPFVGIHMASSRYFPGFAAGELLEVHAVDTGDLKTRGIAEISVEVH